MLWLNSWHVDVLVAVDNLACWCTGSCR